MQRTIWVVTDGTRETPLGHFSTQAGADGYVALLVERYSLGKTLSLHGRHLAPEAGSWSLGLGPTAKEYVVDPHPSALPGTWLVKVDETCRMVSCEFSTRHRSGHSTARYRTGIHAICEAYGTTPHAALDSARKEMMSFLSKDRSQR